MTDIDFQNGSGICELKTKKKIISNSILSILKPQK